MSGFRASFHIPSFTRCPVRRARTVSLGCLALVAFAVSPAGAQVLTVSQGEVAGQNLDFHPTNVTLSSQPLDAQTRQELIRIMDAEQGFAMRPIPKGKHG